MQDTLSTEIREQVDAAIEEMRRSSAYVFEPVIGEYSFRLQFSLMGTLNQVAFLGKEDDIGAVIAQEFWGAFL